MTISALSKVGFLLSAGGSAFVRAFQISGLGAECFHVVTDRHCDAADKAKALGITVEKIDENDREEFSRKAHASFQETGCIAVICHFSRLVGPGLFSQLPTLNIHPSLLPAFPGLRAVEDAATASTPLQGATLHFVDAGIDTGFILAQTVYSVPLNADLIWRHALGYRQKIVLTLLGLDWINEGRLSVNSFGEASFDRSGLPDSLQASPGFVSKSWAEQTASLFHDLPDEMV